MKRAAKEVVLGLLAVAVVIVLSPVAFAWLLVRGLRLIGREFLKWLS
jgi:hypothetical protein